MCGGSNEGGIVMDIISELKKILQARYGEEVRGSIHDAILKCWGNSEATLRKVQLAAQKALSAAEKALNSEQNAETSKDATKQLADTIESKIKNGFFKGEKGDKGDPGGVTTPTHGFINFEIDNDGNLYALYPENIQNVQFELDPDGNLSYEVKDV